MTEVQVEEQTVQETETPLAGPPYLSPTPVRANYNASSASRSSSVTRRVSNNETGRRIIMFLFGIVQAVILLRFIFLLLDARTGNGLVSAINSFSSFFVGPFEGILRTNALHASGSTFDVAAIVALIGWTIIEFVVLAIFQIATRRPAGPID